MEFDMIMVSLNKSLKIVNKLKFQTIGLNKVILGKLSDLTLYTQSGLEVVQESFKTKVLRELSGLMENL